MQPFAVLKLLRAAERVPQTTDSQAGRAARAQCFVDAHGRLTPRGNLELAKFREIRPQVERTARELVKAVVVKDLGAVSFPRCGLALGYAIDKGWLERVDEELITTELGVSMLVSRVVPLRSTWH